MADPAPTAVGAADGHADKPTQEAMGVENAGPLAAPAVAKPEGIMRCINNIPICGGFCAPTANPDPRFLRKFSNEYTMPASGVIMKIGCVMEWSLPCRCIGGLGIPQLSPYRAHVMLFATFLSLFAWVAIIISAIGGLAHDPKVSHGLPWASGKGKMNGNDFLEIDISVRMRVDRINCKNVAREQLCIAWVQEAGFIDDGDGKHSRQIMWEEDLCESLVPLPPQLAAWEDSGFGGEMRNFCQSCGAQATKTVQTVIMGVVTQIPQITTDLQRSTVYGDMNCQSSFGLITSIFGACSTLLALMSFGNECFRLAPTGFERAGMTVEIEWTRGIAMSMIILATLLKFVDALCHLVIQTPQARRTRPPKGITNLEDYMYLACVVGQPVKACV